MSTSPERPTVIVTGASSGIGRELARAFALDGAEVHAVSRPEGRGAEVARATSAEVGRAGAVTHHPADLASLAATREVARRLARDLPRVDALMLNAGAYLARFRATEEGFERTFALNHLSPFLLTHHLTGALGASAAPRIVVTSSGAHAMAGTIDLERAASGERYGAWRAYAWSKAANVLFAREAARRAPHPRLRAYAYHPGFVASRFGAGGGVSQAAFRFAQRLFGRTSVQGADTGHWLATESPAPEPNGGYFQDRGAKRPAAPGRNLAAAAELWRRSEAWVALEPELRWPRPEEPGAAAGAAS